MHQGKDVIGEAGRVGVVLLDPQVGLVVQQAVEHIGGIADADIHHAGAERRVLVGDMGIEGVSLDIENYCTLSSFFIISGFFGNVIFWMLRRSCGDIEHR